MALAGVLLWAGVAPARAEPRRYGVMGDLGLPGGLVASFVVRPQRVVTTYAGLGHNSNSFGMRAGARVLPWATPAAPYLALEGGFYLESGTPGWMRDLAKSAGLDDKTLERLGYRYASGQLGVRIGSGSPAFYLQAGVSFIAASILVLKPKPTYVPPVDLYREQKLHVWAVTGHGGFLFWF